MTAQVYVDVLAVFSWEGELIPTAFVWEDGRKYAIDKVSKPERCASRKAGGTGYRYKFPMEDYQYVIEVNQNAVFDWCQRAAKKFIAQDSKGKIIYCIYVIFLWWLYCSGLRSIERGSSSAHKSIL